MVAAVGCGGGGKTKTVEDLCQEKTTAECQSVATKCGTKVDPCVTARLPLCHDWVAQATASGTRTFTPGNVDACVSKSRSVYAKNGAITPTELAALEDTCNYVFQGTAQMLGSCEVKYDCADKSHICDKGLCAKPVNKNSGELCGNPGEQCKTGSFCQLMEGNIWKCAAKADKNKTCSEDIPCKEAYRCSLGSCTDRAGNSASCGSDDDCNTDAPYCDFYAGGKCLQGLVFASGSASCNAFTGGDTTGAGGNSGGHGGSGGSTGGAGHGGSTGAAGAAAGAGGSTGAAGAAAGAGGSTGAAGAAAGAGGTGGGSTDAGTDV
jgi:hypothetical protein